MLIETLANARGNLSQPRVSAATSFGILRDQRLAKPRRSIARLSPATQIGFRFGLELTVKCSLTLCDIFH